MRFRSLVLLILLPAASIASEENAALAAAVADLRVMVPYERQFFRYVSVLDGKFESVQAVSLTLNYVSRSSVLARAAPVGKLLVRVDVRHYAPRDKDRKEWLATWEKLAFDPTMSLLLTKDTLKFAPSPVTLPKTTRDVKVPVAPYRADDGQTYDFRWEKKEVAAIDGDVLKILAPHIDSALFAEAATLTGSAAPIVNHRYFITRALATIQDAGAFKTLYGGLYYEFAGIPGTEAELQKQLGIPDAAKLFDGLRSDQRVAMFISGVTGSPRAVEILRTPASRDGQGLMLTTLDIRQQDIDIGSHAVFNLLDLKVFAKETLFEKGNGLQGGALWDGNGKRQNEAPNTVVSDRTVPAPYHPRLQGFISCLRCHKTEGGWRKMANDVKTLTKGGWLDIFPEKKQDEIDRLVGLYGGDVELKLLPRARDDYASAILQASGPWKKGKPDQTEVVRVSGDAISDIWEAYWYKPIDAHQALTELGIKSDQKTARQQIRKLIPPPNFTINGRIPEDPRIGALFDGIPINRADFDLVYSFMASRIAAAKKGAT